MSTKLDEWIECHSKYLEQVLPHGRGGLLTALEEYRQSRQWVDGQPPVCAACFAEINGTVVVVNRRYGSSFQWHCSEYGTVTPDQITRHCPIPPSPPLPSKPRIPDEVAKHGDGLYWVRIKGVLKDRRVRHGQVIFGGECFAVEDFHKTYPDAKWTYIPEPTISP